MTEENIISGIEHLSESMIDVKDAFDSLSYRINDLEVKLDNLRVQFDTHNHPWKPEPRYA